MKISLNFGDLVNEMNRKEIKIVFLYKRHGFFLEDKENNLYMIGVNNSSDVSYLDKAITEGKILEFGFVDSSFIQSWEKEVWDYNRVSQFIRDCVA